MSRAITPAAAHVSKQGRIFGMTTSQFVRVAVPLAGGLLSAGAAVLSFRQGGERWAVLMIAGWGITTAFSQSAQAFQEVLEEETP